MKKIEGTPKYLLDYFWKLAKKNDDYVKIENSDVFMYLSISVVGSDSLVIGHYFEQNGDLMADPEMMFYRNQNEEFIPVYYQLDSLAFYEECMKYDVEQKKYVITDETIHDSLVDFFVNDWSNNLIWQQNLESEILK